MLYEYLHKILLLRLSSKTFKSLIKADEQGQIIKIKYKNKLYTTKFIRFFLDSVVDEFLITSLFDEVFKIEDFKKLYFKVWREMTIFAVKILCFCGKYRKN